MPTWGEIREFARSKYTLQNDEDQWFSIVFGLPTGRSQLVVVRRFEAFNKEWAEFRSVVCKEAEMAHKIALKKNSKLAVGALALDDDGDYFLTYSAALDTMDPDEFELPLLVVTATADQLESEYSAGNDDF
jgi:hypothetical protein